MRCRDSNQQKKTGRFIEIMILQVLCDRRQAVEKQN